MQNRQPPLRVRIIEPERRNDPFALMLVAVAFIGLLFVVFAPQGTFTTSPATAQVHR